MPSYRRLYQPGGDYFFTVNLADRSGDALVRNIDALRQAWSYAHTRFPFETVAVAVMPDHLHCIWRLPSGDQDFSTRWSLLKGHFSRSLARAGDAPPGRRVGERGVWQRRFWEHLIRDEDDLARCADYIHANPVKHGHCACVDDWPYSSWRKWNLDITSSEAS